MIVLPYAPKSSSIVGSVVPDAPFFRSPTLCIFMSIGTYPTAPWSVEDDAPYKYIFSTCPDYTSNAILNKNTLEVLPWTPTPKAVSNASPTSWRT